MKNAGEALKDSSLYIRHWIDKMPGVKEESLTDWLLINISDNVKNIKSYSFTKCEEAKITGADWEWWFLFPEYSYRVRVQAKKIKTRDNNYSSITYKNNYGLQIEKLIENSNKENSIPMYVFYTNKIDSTNCIKNILDEGVYIVNANTISEKFINKDIKKIGYNDILQHTIPLSCILNCPLISTNGFNKFVEKYIISENKQNISRGIQGEYKNLPEYLDCLINSNNISFLGWEKDFSSEIKDINGIVIFDNRTSGKQP